MSAPAALPPALARRALGLLVLVMVACHVDRSILNALIEPIKREFGASDTAMGFLTGPAFAVFFALAGLPLASLADRSSRKRVLVAGLVLWSLMTAAQGWARAFWQLAAARLLVGVGEATCAPSSHAILSDGFPPERRASALAIFSLGAHVGTFLGLAFGGWAAASVGWRTAFVAVGLPGLLLAAWVGARLREPARAGGAASGLAAALRALVRRPTFRQSALAGSLYTICAYGFNVWGVSFLIRVHGLGPAQAGLGFGIATGLAGIAGAVVAGRLADRLWRRDPRWAPWIGSLGGVAMVPFSLGFLLAPDARLALALYAAQVFLGSFWTGPTFATLQAVAAPGMRAQASALALLVINVLGLGLGPQLIGLLSDALRAPFGADGLRWAMLALTACAPWAALHGLLAARTLRRDLEQAAA